MSVSLLTGTQLALNQQLWNVQLGPLVLVFPDLEHNPDHPQPQFPHSHKGMGKPEQRVPGLGVPQESETQALAANTHCPLCICQENPVPQVLLFPGTYSGIMSISSL